MKSITENEIKGFTLIEIILAFALIGIILAMSYPFISFGALSFEMTNRQYEVQGDVRLAVDYINEQVRFATDIDLLDTAPSPADTDEYDYIYIDGGRDLIHSSYDGGSSRRERTVASDLVAAGSYFVSEEDGKSLGVILESAREGRPGELQDYDIISEIELPNIAINKRYFPADHTAAKAIKFKVNPVLPTPIPGGGGGTPTPTPPVVPVTVNVKIVIKTPANNNRYFKILLDGVEKTPVKTVAKTYTADFGSFLTNSSHTVSAMEAPSAGGTYTEFYPDTALPVGIVDLVKEIPAP